MRQQDEVRDIVRRAGVVARKDHPALTGAMARLRRRGDLVAVLPGVYNVPGARGEEKVRLAALARWAPEAVLTGSSAARTTCWPTLSGSEVGCALRWAREPRPGRSPPIGGLVGIWRSGSSNLVRQASTAAANWAS